MYPIVIKLNAVFKSRPGNVAFDLGYKTGDYHKK
jgi:hypothetical protein